MITNAPVSTFGKWIGLGERLTGAQHDHHDLCVATMHAHLDHKACLESVILRGPLADVRAFAEGIIAERGVRHGSLNVVSVDMSGGSRSHRHGAHSHDDGHAHDHVHLKPKV